MKNPFRLLISFVAIVIVAGCTSTMVNMANKLDERDRTSQQKGAQSFVERECARFEELKAKGDPDGYYFSAIAFAWKYANQDDTKVFEVKKRYEEAVSKGSNDAKIALGELLVEGRTLPFEVMNSPLPMKDREIERGLRLLSEAATKSCMYKQPLFRGAQCGNVRMFNTAIPIWVLYRDGKHDRDTAQEPWVQPVSKNEALAQKWKQRRDQCKAEIEAYNRKYGCSNY